MVISLKEHIVKDPILKERIEQVARCKISILRMTLFDTALVIGRYTLT